MPKYEFLCNACKETFELTMSIKEKTAAEILCPRCQSADVFQNLSGVNVCMGKSGKSDACGCFGGQCRCRPT